MKKVSLIIASVGVFTNRSRHSKKRCEKKILFAILFITYCGNILAQHPWKITASNIDPKNYYGVTVANGMIGIVSSPEAFKVKDVVLAGAFVTRQDVGLPFLVRAAFTDDGFRAELQDATGVAPAFAIESFSDLDADVRQSILRVRRSAFLPHRDFVRGFVYDVDSHRLREIATGPDA